MPQPVVHRLEAVQVEQDQGGPASVADQALHLGREGPAVRQAGEVVGGRLPADLVQRPELVEREDGPCQRDEHAGEGADLAHAESPVAPFDPEDREGRDRAGQRYGEGMPPDGRRGGGPAVPPRTRCGGGGSGEHGVRHPRQVERPPGLVSIACLCRRQQDVADELGREDHAEHRDDAVDAGAQDGRDRAEQGQQQDVRDRVRQVRRRRQGVQVRRRHRGRDEHRRRHGRHPERADQPVEPRAGLRPGHSGAQQGQGDEDERRVGRQPEHVGDGREGLLRQRGDRKGVHEGAGDVQDGCGRRAPPDQPLLRHPSGGAEAENGRQERGGVEQHDVEDEELDGRVWNEGDAHGEAECDDGGQQDDRA
jgi:hypothetical protein